MDNTLIRALRYLHSSAPESQDNLRMLLEESLKNKYGQGKDIGPLLNVPAKLDYSVTSINTNNQIDLSKDDSKNSTSDNELELDLLKEDLMCIVCNGMGVGARNRLVECADCHNLYHQECHNPSITDEEIESSVSWICATCKEVGSSQKKVGVSSSSSSSSSSVKSSANVNPVPVSTSSSSSTRKFTEQDASSETPQSFSSSGKTSSSKSSSSSSSSNNRLLTPNINIISADKRLQIMKKKAAKMQEKRKLSRP